MMQTKRDILNDPGATLTTADMTDRTASYTIPQMASNNVVIDITGGCDYCKAGKYIMEHHGFVFDVWSQIADGRLDTMYSNQGGGDEYALDVRGHKGTKINYCPMCGRKLDENDKD